MNNPSWKDDLLFREFELFEPPLHDRAADRIRPAEPEPDEDEPGERSQVAVVPWPTWILVTNANMEPGRANARLTEDVKRLEAANVGLRCNRWCM